jgi:hypothetical protein
VKFAPSGSNMACSRVCSQSLLTTARMHISSTRCVLVHVGNLASMLGPRLSIWGQEPEGMFAVCLFLCYLGFGALK